jgi:hypothetical protein
MNKFAARKDGKNSKIFVVGFMFFPLFGIISLIAGGLNSEMTIPAVISILFGAIIITYILIRKSAAGFLYAIDDEGILLKRGRKKRVIPFKDIYAAGRIKGEKLQKLMSILAKPMAEAQKQMNVKKWWKNAKIYGDITKWVSVVITETETRSGSPLDITQYQLNLEGEVVTLKLKNGELILLTPKQTAEFVSAIVDQNIRTLTDDECIGSVPVPDLTNTPSEDSSAGRRLRIGSLITALVIIVAILTWFFTIGPGTKESEVVDTSEENAEEVEEPLFNGEWEDASKYIFVMRADHPDADLEILKNQRASMPVLALIAESMAVDYKKNHPDTVSSPDIDRILTLLNFESIVRLFEKRTVESGFEIHIYLINGENLRESFNGIAGASD